MKKQLLPTTFGALFLVFGTVHANIAAPPPSAPTEVELTGKLSWERRQLPNGKEQHGNLLLTTAAGTVITLGTADQTQPAKPAAPINPDKYIGQEVTAKVMARLRGPTVARVVQVLSLKSAAKAARP